MTALRRTLHLPQTRRSRFSQVDITGTAISRVLPKIRPARRRDLEPMPRQLQASTNSNPVSNHYNPNLTNPTLILTLTLACRPVLGETQLTGLPTPDLYGSARKEAQTGRPNKINWTKTAHRAHVHRGLSLSQYIHRLRVQRRAFRPQLVSPSNRISKFPNRGPDIFYQF